MPHGGGYAARKISQHEEVSMATLTQPTAQASVTLRNSVETTYLPVTYIYQPGGRGRELESQFAMQMLL